MADNPVETGNRHIIGPGTEVLGGVFLGRNAIVVDFEEKPEPYEFAYDRFGNILSDPSQVSALEIGTTVSEVVRRILPFSRHWVKSVLRFEADSRGQDRIRSTDEIGLSKFMEAGGGICQHQTLLAGALLRIVQKRHDIGGEVGVDWVQDTSDDPERHIWLRYVRGDEKIIIDDSRPTSQAFSLEHPLQQPTDRIYIGPDDGIQLNSG